MLGGGGGRRTPWLCIGWAGKPCGGGIDGGLVPMLKPDAPLAIGGGGGTDGIPPEGAGLGPLAAAIGGGGGIDPGIGGGGALGGFAIGAPGGSPCGGGGGGGSGAWGGGGKGLGGTPEVAVPLAVEGGCGLFASGGLVLKYNCNYRQVSIEVVSGRRGKLKINDAHRINKKH